MKLRSLALSIIVIPAALATACGSDYDVCVVTASGEEICGESNVKAWCDTTDFLRRTPTGNPEIDAETARTQRECDELRGQ